MSIKRPPAQFTVKHDILGVFVVTDADGGRVVSYEGTAFIVAPHLIVTCWHCVRRELPAAEHYAVAVQGDNNFHHLSDIEPDPAGLDLATAHVDELVPTLSLKLARDGEVLQNLDVVTYGYPLGIVTTSPDGNGLIDAPGRVLRGYVTRLFTDRPTGFSPTRAIELDMPTPAGLSGAPVMVMGADLSLVGVVYGSHAVARIEEVASVDRETGETIPETQRIVSFGAAHHITSVRKLRGKASGGRRLEELMSVR
jgi:hypothetical protein